MNHDLKAPSLIPVLAVEQVEDALEFYKALGFSEVSSIPDERGRIVHAHLRKEGNALFLGRLDVSPYPSHPRASMLASSTAGQRGAGVTLILQVEDLATVYEFVRGRKLQVLAEPVDEYYGDRVFFFLDPFGYEWKISQPI